MFYTLLFLLNLPERCLSFFSQLQIITFLLTEWIIIYFTSSQQEYIILLWYKCSYQNKSYILGLFGEKVCVFVILTYAGKIPSWEFTDLH